jgi:hypothetical protein
MRRRRLPDRTHRRELAQGAGSPPTPDPSRGRAGLAERHGSCERRWTLLVELAASAAWGAGAQLFRLEGTAAASPDPTLTVRSPSDAPTGTILRGRGVARAGRRVGMRCTGPCEPARRPHIRLTSGYRRAEGSREARRLAAGLESRVSGEPAIGPQLLGSGPTRAQNRTALASCHELVCKCPTREDCVDARRRRSSLPIAVGRDSPPRKLAARVRTPYTRFGVRMAPLVKWQASLTSCRNQPAARGSSGEATANPARTLRTQGWKNPSAREQAVQKHEWVQTLQGRRPPSAKRAAPWNRSPRIRPGRKRRLRRGSCTLL